MLPKLQPTKDEMRVYHFIFCNPLQSLRLGAINCAICFVRSQGCIWSDAVLVCTKRSVWLQPDARRCIWSDAVLVCTKRSVWLQTEMRCIWSDAVLVCSNFLLPKRRLWTNEHLKGRTKRSISPFKALFKGVSTWFGRLVAEKCFEKTHRTFRSVFQNLRLGDINFVQKDQFDYNQMQCIWSDAVLVCTKRSVWLQTDARRCIWSAMWRPNNCAISRPLKGV